MMSDAAVLRADDQAEMLAWLQDNRFFIPDPLANAVAPYIRPGGYFLALKLLSDRDAGDIAPLVLEYESDLPMIPSSAVSAASSPPVTSLVSQPMLRFSKTLFRPWVVVVAAVVVVEA